MLVVKMTDDGHGSLCSKSDQVTGNIYAANYAGTTPVKLTTAVYDMGVAYADAAGRAAHGFASWYDTDGTTILSDIAAVNVNAGLIGGTTFKAGVYKWSTAVKIDTAKGDITLTGNADSVFIFIIAQDLVVASDMNIILTKDDSGSDTFPRHENIYIQVAGAVTVGTGAHLEGTILCATKVVFNTGSSLNGRIFSQTAVTLQMATINSAPASA